jgi:hypothetical protein
MFPNDKGGCLTCPFVLRKNRYLGIGSYGQWDEETRMSWLMSELNGKRPLLPKERPLHELNFTPEVVQNESTCWTRMGRSFTFLST